MREMNYSAFNLAITVFLPGVLAVMLLVNGVSILLSREPLASFKNKAWWLAGLEVILLTVGFLSIRLLLKARLASRKWRAVAAGILSVLMLTVLSVFTQGSHLPRILAFSIIAGAVSALSLLSRK